MNVIHALGVIPSLFAISLIVGLVVNDIRQSRIDDEAERKRRTDLRIRAIIGG